MLLDGIKDLTRMKPRHSPKKENRFAFCNNEVICLRSEITLSAMKCINIFICNSSEVNIQSEVKSQCKLAIHDIVHQVL